MTPGPDDFKKLDDGVVELIAIGRWSMYTVSGHDDRFVIVTSERKIHFVDRSGIPRSDLPYEDIGQVPIGDVVFLKLREHQRARLIEMAPPQRHVESDEQRARREAARAEQDAKEAIVRGLKDRLRKIPLEILALGELEHLLDVLDRYSIWSIAELERLCKEYGA